MADAVDPPWELESGVERAASCPDFWIPSAAERSSIPPGYSAKLLVVVPAGEEDGEPIAQVERMWVEVRGRDGDSYEGVLLNTPANATATLRRGDGVVFGAEHVC